MIVTKFNHLTTRELIQLAESRESLTDLEREMLKRLMEYAEKLRRYA